MYEPDSRPMESLDSAARAEGVASAEPDLAELISAWYGAARARLLTHRRTNWGLSLPAQGVPERLSQQADLD